MTSLFFRTCNTISVLVAVGVLTACASTNSGSGAGGSADSGTSNQIEPDSATVTPSQVVTPDDDAVPSPVQISEPMEASSSDVRSEVISDGATTGSAASTDVIEGIAEFPEQRYEIEESLEVFEEEVPAMDEPLVMEDFQAPEDSYEAQVQTQADSDIDRLRDELATSEAELERIRAEEAERDFAASLARSAASDASDSGATVDTPAGVAPPSRTTTAQAAGVPEPADSFSISDLPGKPLEYSIYFAYNQAALEQDFESVIVQHAQFLKQYPDLAVEIQGNCDERGSREYNIALGERRAHTVKRALELLGVEGNRISTVSFGSEKPIAFGRDEESYRLNRRADFVYGEMKNQ